jgi:hypothetical protein
MSALTEAVENPEARPLAREMAAAVRGLVESYMNSYGLSREESVARVREPGHPDYLAMVMSRPPDEVSWYELETLLESDPERALQRWEEIKRAAQEELRSGHRASKVVEAYNATPWKRAQFFCLLQELAEGCQPRNGLERQLLETMAQARTAMEYWQGVLVSTAALAAAEEHATLNDKRRWEPPRVPGFRAVEQAAQMVDRFNRIFLRTLRALQDLRRCPPSVVVQHAGQVNVGGQQVNVNSTPTG